MPSFKFFRKKGTKYSNLRPLWKLGFAAILLTNFPKTLYYKEKDLTRSLCILKIQGSDYSWGPHTHTFCVTWTLNLLLPREDGYPLVYNAKYISPWKLTILNLVNEYRTTVREILLTRKWWVFYFGYPYNRLSNTCYIHYQSVSMSLLFGGKTCAFRTGCICIIFSGFSNLNIFYLVLIFFARFFKS